VLARAVSAELKWPLISKDEIKEALASVLPPTNNADAALLGRAATAVLLRMAASATSGAVPSCSVAGRPRSVGVGCATWRSSRVVLPMFTGRRQGKVCSEDSAAGIHTHAFRNQTR
jgi:hypothetical protein